MSSYKLLRIKLLKRKMVMMIPPRSIRKTLYWKMQSKLLWIKWQKIRVMNQVKRSLMASTNSLTLFNTESSLRRCLIIIENFSDWKINNKYLNLKPNKEVFQFHKSFHPKRKSCKRKQRRWLISIVGLFLLTVPLGAREIVMYTVSCSSSQPSCQTKRLIGISMKQWWSFQLKSSRQLLIRLIFQNLKKRSIDSSDQMLSTFQLGFSMMSQERRNIRNWKRQHPMKPMTRKPF